MIVLLPEEVVADIHEVAGTNVVRANGPIDGATLRRGCNEEATHHVSDFSKSGYWGARLGVLVVPKNQVKELRKIIRYKVKSTEKKR